MSDTPASRVSFSDIPPRRRLTPEAAQRHTQLVRTLRLTVPALAVALLATYALNAAPQAVDAEFLRQFSGTEEPGRELRLDNPRYRAETRDGSAFQVSAQTARRNPDEANVIRFDRPEAFRGEGAEGPARLQAETGTLDTDTDLFDGQDVRLVQSIGGQDFTLTTDAARVDLKGKTIRSDVGVQGESASGALRADGIEVSEDGRVRLDGRVKLRFDPRKAPGKAPDEKEPAE